MTVKNIVQICMHAVIFICMLSNLDTCRHIYNRNSVTFNICHHIYIIYSVYAVIFIYIPFIYMLSNLDTCRHIYIETLFTFYFHQQCPECSLIQLTGENAAQFLLLPSLRMCRCYWILVRYAM